MNNREFASKDSNFRKACVMTANTLFPGENNKTEAIKFADKIQSTRQASKFKRGKGIVWKTINHML